MDSLVPCSTPMEVNLKLSKDDGSEEVDASLYRSLVGSPMYLTETRPDLMFAASMLSRFMSSPKKSHWEAGKRILRYVVGTIDHGIHYKRLQESILIGYSDSDWGGDADNHKSTSGYVFNTGSGACSFLVFKETNCCCSLFL